MSAATTDWKDEARQLREQGLSEREIAEAVSKSPSSVHEAVKDVDPGDGPAAAIPGQQDLEGGEVPANAFDREAFEAEAGEPVGAMPPSAPQDNSAPPLDEVRVNGTVQLGLFDAGGKKPSSASVTLAGGRVGLVDGRAFRKGDVVSFHGTAVVTAVAQQDKTDGKTGIVVSAEQKHTARITDLTIDAA